MTKAEKIRQSEPDFEGFDGIYVGSKDGYVMPKSDYDFKKVAAYMKKHNVEFAEIPKDVLETLKFKK